MEECFKTSQVELPECKEAMREGRLTADGVVLNESGTSLVTKAAIEPVWSLAPKKTSRSIALSDVFRIRVEKRGKKTVTSEISNGEI